MDRKVGGIDVSRETYEKLQRFSELVLKWTSKINLISSSSIPDIWDRHICDSAQIYKYAPEKAEKWVDIGSGGGFPGIVVAILACADAPHVKFTLIESDQRKVTFLRTAARELQIDVKVIADRIEYTPKQSADVVTARALTALSSIIPLAMRHLSPTGVALLHKGKRSVVEIADARALWQFDLEEHRSLTDPDGRLLAIRNLSPVGQ